MSAALVALAVVAVTGGIVAVAAREARGAVLGFALVAVTAPLVSDPFPDALSLAARLVAAILASYLLWVAFRPDVPTRGSTVGWPIDALLAAAGAAAAVGSALTPRVPEALAAGFALAAIAIVPLVRGRDAVRLGVGLLLATHAATLVRTGLGGAPSAFEQLVLAGLVVAVAAATANLALAAMRAGGSLLLGSGPRPAAHPAAAVVSTAQVAPRSAGAAAAEVTRPAPDGPGGTRP